jgi:hypothetical protein
MTPFFYPPLESGIKMNDPFLLAGRWDRDECPRFTSTGADRAALVWATRPQESPPFPTLLLLPTVSVRPVNPGPPAAT